MADENKDIKRTEIASLGEFGLINHLTKGFPIQQESTQTGIGDDAAVLDFEAGQSIVISTDLLIEGIHFDLMYMPLKHLGYKSVAVNVSDICAMNAQATQITISIAMSNRFSVEALEEFYAGVRAACEAYEVDLIGGDTSSSNKGLIISVTAVGQAVADKLTYRSGAKEGDILCVSGDLGAAYLGLQILEREKQLYLSDSTIKPDLDNQAYVVGRQLKPEARTDMLRYFREAALVPTSMIDVSDGLSSDLLHLCQHSSVGAIVEEANLPIHPDAQLLAISFQLDPSTCALSGGEDYELLFTVSPEDLEKVRFMPDVYIIGEMKSEEYGIQLLSTGGKLHDLQAQGWSHFKNQQNDES